MSGKLIHNLKRKREESKAAECESPTGNNTKNNENREDSSECKREKLCDCEKYRENVRSSSPPRNDSNPEKSEFLLEALKKIIELQNDLEEFDGESENSSSEESEVSFLNEDEYGTGNDAEALGFAMCARETLLFLQREGVPVNSPIYQTLRERLIGRSQGIPI